MLPPNPTAGTPGPTVKITPTINAGESVFCKATGEKFKVLKVLEDGNLICEGRAGVMPKEAALTELPAETKADEA